MPPQSKQINIIFQRVKCYFDSRRLTLSYAIRKEKKKTEEKRKSECSEVKKTEYFKAFNQRAHFKPKYFLR